MTVRRLVGSAAASAAVFAGGLAGFAAPAQAAYPTTNFTVTYGNTQTSGVITWYNRSVHVDVDSIRVTVGQCRQVEAYAYVEASGSITELDRDESYMFCNKNSTVTKDYGPDNFDLDADVAGGANRVEILMRDDSNNIVKIGVYHR